MIMERNISFVCMKPVSLLNDVTFPIPEATDEDAAIDEALRDAMHTTPSPDCLCPMTSEEEHLPEERVRKTTSTDSSGPKVVVMFFFIQ